MPTINVLFNDLELLIGQSLPRDREELTDLLAFVKGEVESLEGQELSIEIKDGNRPDLWCIEGIARAMRGALGIENGLKVYPIEAASRVEIIVDPKLQHVRPYIASAVVRDVHLTDEAVRGFIHLQEKLDQTYGRKRSRTSIGFYNFELIKLPLHYRVAKPEEISFTPLESELEMNLREILDSHPKGLEYGHIVKAFDEWPILHDANGSVLSFPPIINSDDLGKITRDTTDILVEVTGTDHQTVLNTLTLVALSIADRGGMILTTRIVYPYIGMEEEITPNLDTYDVQLDVKLVEDLLGLTLSQGDIVQLLRRARFGTHLPNGRSILVRVPCYRVDIMHPIDIVEDIGIMYGYNNIDPRWPQMDTFGEIDGSEIMANSVREVMIGLGFQEVFTFSMTNLQNLFGKMNLDPEHVIKVVNPSSERFTHLRSWLIPSLMEFLSKNTHISYPQRVFEIGECAVLETTSQRGVRELKKVAGLSIHSKAAFSEIKAVLDTFLLNLGVTYGLGAVEHTSFIEGRAGKIFVERKECGVVGEFHPNVLEAWGLENPAIGFELDLSTLFG